MQEDTLSYTVHSFLLTWRGEQEYRPTYIYNHKKKGWYTLSDLGEISIPRSLNAILIQVMLSKALPDPPILIDGNGIGKNMVNGKQLSIDQCLMISVRNTDIMVRMHKRVRPRLKLVPN